MFKLPSNIHYRIFDKNFKASTARYIIKEDKAKYEEVKKNLDSISDVMNAKGIAVVHQTHSADVHYATTSTDIANPPKADAIYTDKKNIVLGIQTADCVPVLIADKEGEVIGAAHCGWKGAVNNILSNLIAKMESAGTSQFMAIIGPSIHQESYEVDRVYFDVFLNEDIENAKFFIPSNKPEHFMFDLPGYVRMKLNLLGISEIYHIYEDTYRNSDKYPSYRRHCHTGEEYKSSILSTIVMR